MSDLEQIPILDSQTGEAKCEGKKVEKPKKKDKKPCKGKIKKYPKKYQMMKKMMKCKKMQKMNVPPFYCYSMSPFYGYSMPPPFWKRAYYIGMLPAPMPEYYNFYQYCKFGMPSPPKFGSGAQYYKHFYKHCRN